MTDRQSPTSTARRPWFYKNWFLVITFVFGWPIFPALFLWPVWPVLIMRSPWHKGQFIRILAWAMLAVGGYMLALQLITGGASEEGASVRSRELAIFGVLPGLALTGITQALWTRYRMDLRGMNTQTGPPAPEPEGPTPLVNRGEKPRRRARRRRGYRPGGSSRR